MISIEALEHHSRRAGWVTLGGAILLFAAMAYSTWWLAHLNEQVAQKRAEAALQRAEVDQRAAEVVAKEAALRAMDEQIDALRRQKEDLLTGLREQQERLARLEVAKPAVLKALDSELPINAVVTPHVSSEPIENPKNQTSHYQFSLWLDVPTRRRSEIQEVTYFFNHPSFLRPRMVAEDPKDGFRIRYEGWGCLPHVIITLSLKDGDSRDIDFDMCSALDSESAQTNAPLPASKTSGRVSK